MKIIIVTSIIAVFSCMSFAYEDIDNLIKVANERIDKRSAKLKSQASVFDTLKKENRQVHQVPREDALTFGNVKLPCTKSRFMWGLKKPELDYEDCVFKLNIASSSDIKKLYATLQSRSTQGWVVERNEVFKQTIVNDKNINNIERYRFFREKPKND